MQIKYFILALGTLFAGQALAAPVDASSALVSALLDTRNVDVAATAGAAVPAQAREVARTNEEEQHDAPYLAARDATAHLAVQAHPTDPSLEVSEHRSAKGQKYRLVRPKGSMAAEHAALQQRGEAAPLERRSSMLFKKAVSWAARSYGSTDAAFFQTTGIGTWSIVTATGSAGIFYKWQLNFSAQQPYNYGFTDAEGDTYWCNVYYFGQHYIDYNSGAPSITQVQGWA